MREQIFADADRQYQEFKAKTESSKLPQAKKAERLREKYEEIQETIDQRAEGSRLWWLANRCIFGTDANERMARTSKEKIKAESDERFFADLGLHYQRQVDLPKAFAVNWKDFERWGGNFNQQASTGEDLTRGKYPVCELGSILELVQYGTSGKTNNEGKGTPILRINNIKDRELKIDDLKHIRLPDKTLESLLLKDGDISQLANPPSPTRSST